MLKTADWIEINGRKLKVVQGGNKEVFAETKDGFLEVHPPENCNPLPECTSWEDVLTTSEPKSFIINVTVNPVSNPPPTDGELRIQHGKYYELANGEIVGPVQTLVHFNHTVTANQKSGYWWHPDGTSNNPELSIVKEVQP
jgi:hypothetical protein